MIERNSLAAPLPPQADWEALADRLAAEPFLEPGWHAAWWRAFGHGSLSVLTSRAEGRLSGVLPVARSRGSIRSPTNWHTVGFGFLADGPGAAEELAASLFADRPRSVTLGFVDPRDPGVAAWRAAARTAGYRTLSRSLVRSPYLDLAGDWESYLRSRSKNLRSQLARTRRALADLGPVGHEVHDGSDRLAELLAEGFRIEASGWKGARGTAIASSPVTLGFYTDLARWAAARGYLRLSFLRVGGRAVAFELCLEKAGVHSLIKGGYDPEAERFGPGTLLTEENLRLAFRSGIRRFDLGGDALAWKLRWTDTVRQRLLLQAFAPTPPGLTQWGAFAFGRPALKRALEASRSRRKPG